MVSYSPTAERVFIYIKDASGEIRTIKLTNDEVNELRNLLWQSQIDANSPQGVKND
jgi:hypothetical protein